MFQVEIRLLDEPDSPPVFVGVEDEVEVAEDVQAGFVITTVDVTDADEQQTIKYDINDGGHGHFDIDASTGTWRLFVCVKPCCHRSVNGGVLGHSL